MSASRHTRELGIANNSRLARKDSQWTKTRADVLGDAMARAETRAAGGAMPQECRMRIAMMAVMTAAAAAGSASASMTVLDPFTLVQSTSQLNFAGTFQNLSGSPFGSRSVNTLGPQEFTSGSSASVSCAGGDVTFSVGGAKTFLQYAAGAVGDEDATVDLSAMLANGAAFQVTMSNISGAGTLIVLLEDASSNIAWYEASAVSSDGLITMAKVEGLSDATFDALSVKFMSLNADSEASFSGTLTNFTIPAPGALALLGVAGIVGGRRRR